jgi:hypothetical protein
MQSPYQPYQPKYVQQPPPVGFMCPSCLTTAPPLTASKVSTTGWVIFALLFLSCFGTVLSWFGLMFREHYKVCSQCGIKLG